MIPLPKFSQLATVFTRLSKREKIILYGAAFFVSLTIMDRLIVFPIFDRLVSLDKEIKEKEASVKKNLRILSHKERILADSKRYGSYVKDFTSEEEEATAILKEIETLASKTAIYLIDLKPAGLVESEMSKRYSVNLNCEAEMQGLVDFMYKLETSKMLLTVDRFQITPKSKESSVARCRMTISKIVTP